MRIQKWWEYIIRALVTSHSDLKRSVERIELRQQELKYRVEVIRQKNDALQELVKGLRYPGGRRDDGEFLDRT